MHVYSGATFNGSHNTFAGNPSTAVYYVGTAGGELRNNLVWSNDSGVVLGGATAVCNDTQGAVLPGAGNISANPRFITTARGDYHLAPSSPARDTCGGGSSPDLDNVGRPKGLNYDMGAFELWCANNITDVNGSGKTDIVDVGLVASDFNDLAYLPQHDINCDGQVNVTDIILVAGAWTP